MVFSMIASGLVYAGAVSSKELKSKLSDLEDQKASVKAELDSLAGKVDEVAKDPCPPCRRRSSSPRKKLRR